MNGSSRWSRPLVVAGLVGMLFGAVDPLEGSVVILAGAALVALGARLGDRSRRALPYAALVLVAAGVAALFGLSAVGGVGGRSGHSMWWMVVLLPYPVGWILGLVGSIRGLRATSAPAHS